MSLSHYPKDSIIPFKDDDGPIYPFKKMSVGDHFFVPVQSTREVRAVYSNISSYRQRHPKTRYKTKVIVVNGVKGVRVWRVKNQVDPKSPSPVTEPASLSASLVPLGPGRQPECAQAACQEQ